VKRPRRSVLVCLVGIAGVGTPAVEIFPSVAAGSAGKPGILFFGPEEPLSRSVHATRVSLRGQVRPFGLATHWEIRYSSEVITSCKEGIYGGSGTVEFPSEAGSLFTVEPHHLTSKATYHAVLCAENRMGSTTATAEFTTTPVGPPEIIRLTYFHGVPESVRTTSARFETTVESDGAATEYHVEYANSVKALDKKEGILVSGGSVSEAEDFSKIEPHLEGLEPATEYYLRVVAGNVKGVTSETFAFTTRFVHPDVTLFASAIGKITGSSVDVGLDGGAFVYPGTFETLWFFERAPSETGPWTQVAGAEGTISQAEADEAEHPVMGIVEGLQSGTTYYVRVNAENSKGPATNVVGGPLDVVGFETSEPPRAETFAVHGVHGDALRLFASVRQAGIDTHYHFQFVTQDDFERSGWAGAETSPEEDAGSGTTHIESRGLKAPLVVFDSQIVAGDVLSLRSGVKYRFRVVASNVQGTVVGSEQVLSVPVAVGGGSGSGEACPNGEFRTGLSLHLPDCRAYEQVTPVNKEGAQELFQYSATMNGHTLVGEDGEHVMHEAALTHYGTDAGPYVFSRTTTGWRLTAAAPRVEAGVNRYLPRVFDRNLTQFGFESNWTTAENSAKSASPTVEFRAGPVGGPYATVATVTRKQAEGGGWVASSEDFNHLFLQIQDHVLLGSPTGTASGGDLYEYFEGGLRQVNVLSGGGKIGSCGATIAEGFAEPQGHRHAVSADGSRVFFEAVPGSECSMPSHLYVRVGGSETRDLGVYRFGASNAQGTMLVLANGSGELVLYDVESKSVKPMPVKTGAHPVVSERFAAIYFSAQEQLTPEAPAVPESEVMDLYRYDIASGALRYLVQVKHAYSQEPSPDGRYDYFRALGVTGLPAGVEHCRQTECAQLFRFDNVDSVIECVSCASPFDPEPALGVENEAGALINGLPVDGVPGRVYESGDGSYAFFVTPSALVPGDQNGEVPAEPASCGEGCPEHPGGSPSNDVYEWRGVGVRGCVRLAGCVSLISPGTDGYLVGLLGSAHEGRDVFFTTHSGLVAADNDGAGDIYDARIGGGFPTPVSPVECEGDACSTPVSPPVDQTPSSSTFRGPGNLSAQKGAKPKHRGVPRACFKRGKHGKRVRVRCVKSKSKDRKGRKAPVKHALNP